MEVLGTETFKAKIFDYEQSQEWKFKGKRPAIIDFYADWCGPCQQLAPVLAELAQDYAGKLDIYKVDTDASPELAALFGVRGIPALLFIPADGQPTMSAGFVPRPGLEKAISDIFGIGAPSPLN